MVSLVLMGYEPTLNNQIFMSLSLMGAISFLAVYGYKWGGEEVGARGVQAGPGANQIMPVGDGGRGPAKTVFEELRDAQPIGLEVADQHGALVLITEREPRQIGRLARLQRRH